VLSSSSIPETDGVGVLPQLYLERSLRNAEDTAPHSQTLLLAGYEKGNIYIRKGLSGVSTGQAGAKYESRPPQQRSSEKAPRTNLHRFRRPHYSESEGKYCAIGGFRWLLKVRLFISGEGNYF
jgi:hypothetical protein